jgi:signal transduction histidine kinase
MMRAQNTTPLEQRFTEEQIEALLFYGTELSLAAGDYLFDETSVVDSFYVVLEGEIRISRLDGAEEIQLGIHYPRDFTGGLAVLTGRRSIHRGQAAVPSRVLEIDSETFRRVAAQRPEIADVFISGLARRMRETQRAFRQQEKMAALGKLSAGLAHELNNPAAAARRASEALRDAASKAQLLSLEHDERFSTTQRERLAELRRQVMAYAEVNLDPLARSDREDEVAFWFEEKGFGNAWDLAPTMVEAGLDTRQLERLTNDFEDEGALTGALEWLGAALELASLANEVGRSAARISELVEAIKEHTYMDRDSYGATDVREGLDSALTILGHKLKEATVTRDYEKGLPRIWAHAGELNQVWINLLDNATDAVEGRGRIAVRAYDGGNNVAVEISDDGPGIPREMQVRIFEPFFTTKEIGESTGLGLDIARRIIEAHGGEVTFESEPGNTRFVVRLPLEGRRQEARAS